MATVVVTRPLPEAGLRALHDEHEVITHDFEESTEELLIDAAMDAEALLTVLSDPVTERVFESCPRLRVVAQFAVGHDNIDLAAARRAGVAVTHTPGVLTEATADFAFTLLLALARRIREAEAYVREGRFRRWETMLLLGTELSGKTIGILGMGRIGRAVARRALGFGMNVLYHNRHRVNPTYEVQAVATYVSFEDLLRESDVLTLHCPLNRESLGLINSRTLAMMKPSSFLINTARGAIVDESALATALESGTIAGAGLDVYQHEPRVLEALLTLPNVVLAPHLGSATVETRTEMARMCATSILSALRHEEKVPYRIA